MSIRSGHPYRVIVETIIERKQETGSWGGSTADVARRDAQRILEALVGALGFDRCKEALIEQGFEADAYDYILAPLVHEANARWREIQDRLRERQA